MTQNHCRIGILGAGRIGKRHAENLSQHLPMFKLLAIADPDINEKWAKSLNIKHVFNEAAPLIHHPDLDAILIASPSALHVEHILAASAAKKAIFCEKPLGVSEDKIPELLAKLEKDNTFLQVGFNRRFDENFAYLKQCIMGNDIGSPQLISITSRDPVCPPTEYAKTSGGLFFDMSIHDFDMARFLMGSDIIEVFATGARLIDPQLEIFEDVDTAIIQLRFASGALGVINNSRQAIYGYDQRVEVLGSKGLLQAENSLNNTVKLFNQTETLLANPKYFFLERYHQAFLSEMKAFYQAWSEKAPSPVSALEAYKAMNVAFAANRSLKSGQPVSLL